MPITLNGTTGITNDGGYTGDGVSFADTTPANTLVTTTGGNVGIGTASPSFVSGYGGVQISGVGGNSSIFKLTNSTTGTTSTDGFDLILGNASSDAYVWQRESAPLVFGTASTERMRIDSSGNLLVGTTANPNTAKIAIGPTAQNGISIESNSTSVVMNQILFKNPNGIVGGITTSGTSTSFNTSSDYRLKENIAPMMGALGIVQQLKPVTYNWKTDGAAGQGFIAHELQAVVPECVTGEKDAVETVDEFDKDGKKIGTKEVPKYQGIDTSFLVATLTAAIQELKATVDAQAARIAALENTPAET
jgi:hypothetical protein